MLTAQADAELAESPWLEPFIEPDDTTLQPARERYEHAQADCRMNLRRNGTAVYKRLLTAAGYETTAWQANPAKDAP